MKKGRVIFIAVVLIIISIGIYFMLIQRASRPSATDGAPLPECVYGPTNAVLNYPCKRAENSP